MKKRTGIRKQLLSAVFSFSLVFGSIPVQAGETMPVETEVMTEQAVQEAAAEPETEKVTEAVTETPAEKNTEAVTEAAVEKITEAVTETPAEKNTEAVTEAPAEKATEAVTEAPTEKVTATMTGAATEKVTEVMAEAMTEKVTEAVTEVPAESEKETVTETATEAPVIEPETEAVTEAMTERTSELEMETVLAASKVLYSSKAAPVNEAEVKVEIIPANPVFNNEEQQLVSGVKITIDGAEQVISVTDPNYKALADQYKIKYSISFEKFSNRIPSSKAAGGEYVKVQITVDGKQYEAGKLCSIQEQTITNEQIEYHNLIFDNTGRRAIEFISTTKLKMYGHTLYIDPSTTKFQDRSEVKKTAGFYTVKPRLSASNVAFNFTVAPIEVEIQKLKDCRIDVITQDLTFMNCDYKVSDFVQSVQIVGLKSFVEGTDYTVSFADPSVQSVKDAGEYEIKVEVISQDILNSVEWASGYGSSITKKVKILKNPSTDWQITPADMTYDAQAHTATDLVEQVLCGGVVLTKGTDYLVEFSGNETVTDAGAYQIKIKANPESAIWKNFAHDYKGDQPVAITVNINPATLKEGWLTHNPATFTYNGMEQTPSISFKAPDSITLVADEYGVSYKDEYGNKVDHPTNAGTYILVVTGRGNFTGTLERTFAITPKELTLTPVGQTITYGDEISSITQDVAAAGLANGDIVANVELGTVNEDVTDNGIISINSAKIMENGTDVTANYNITYQTGNLIIQPKSVTVSRITAEDKTYDASAEITLDCSNAVFAGLVGTDTLSVTAAGTATDKHAGENKAVTIRDITLADGAGKASNYEVDAENSQKETVVTVFRKPLTIDIKVADKQYDGLDTAVISKAELQGLMENDDVMLKNGTATFASVDVAEDIPVAFTEFTLEGADAGNYALTQPSGITADIYNTYAAEEYTVAPMDWTNGTVTVTAAEGHLISEENKDDSAWSETLNYSDETGKEGKTVTVYLRNVATNAISLSEEITYFIDKTNPTGTIELADTAVWNEFSEDITFDDYYNEMKVIKIMAEDTLSGIASVEYCESASAMTLEEVKAVETWEAYGDGVAVTLEDAKRFVYIARITDAAGNVTYLSTDGSVYDTTLPRVNGVTDGETYYTTQKVMVSDYNLEKVTLNGEEQIVKQETADSTPIGTADVVLEGDRDAVYEIIAKDKAGNMTTLKVTMKPIETLTENIQSVTEETLKPEDRGKLEQTQENIAKVDTSNATDDEKEALKKAEENCDELIGILDTAKEEADHAEKQVEDTKKDGVSVTEKDTLETQKDNLADMLEKNEQYLPEAEKKKLQDEIADLNAVIDVLSKIGQIQTVIDQVKTESGETVVPEHEEAVRAFEAAQEAYDKLSEKQKAMLGEDVKAALTTAGSAVTAYKIIEGDGQSWKVGSDSGLSFTANGLLDKFVSVTVDGSILDQEDYSVKAGSTVVTLKAEYLNSLKAGAHTIVVNYVNGATNAAEFTVAVTETETETETDTKPEIDTETEVKEETDKKPEIDTETEVEEETNTKPEAGTEAGKGERTDPDSEASSEAAKTGDDTNLMLCISMLLLSGAAMLTVLVNGLTRRRK